MGKGIPGRRNPSTGPMKWKEAGTFEGPGLVFEHNEGEGQSGGGRGQEPDYIEPSKRIWILFQVPWETIGGFWAEGSPMRCTFEKDDCCCCVEDGAQQGKREG